ncbi:hypothetical protein ACFC1I_03245 [Microbacterium sp. NPDC056044]|uniref:hypothetical protein n=1 Tax=Microbacterium sp. NPDC056044 TaxID=3345690 RepID=UPI0035D74D7B
MKRTVANGSPRRCDALGRQRACAAREGCLEVDALPGDAAGHDGNEFRGAHPHDFAPDALRSRHAEGLPLERGIAVSRELGYLVYGRVFGADGFAG